MSCNTVGRDCRSSVSLPVFLEQAPEIPMTAIPQVRIHAPEQFALDTVAAPRPGPDDVLLDVRQCGICGSDLSYVAMGGLPGNPAPMPLGHELSAVVRDVGANVRGFAVGDRVVVNP